MLASQIFIDAFGLYPPDRSTAAVASVILLLITLAGSAIYYRVIGYEKKYMTIGGRGFYTGIYILRGLSREGFTLYLNI